MTDGTFEKIKHSDRRLYGPQKLLLCGFSPAAQPKFMTLLKMAGLDSIPVVWAAAGSPNETLAALLDLPNGSGVGGAGDFPRAVIASGITQNQLHTLMTICRQSGMQPALWAALTPTSATWPLRRLLTELEAEREALRQAKEK
ncbi:MAG: DUF3783 domain-containing protein [Desulfosarcina sp.]